MTEDEEMISRETGDNMVDETKKLVWPSENLMHEQFVTSWKSYPSQDNEGYLPDRGGFKCGWYACYNWLKSVVKPVEIPSFTNEEKNELQLLKEKLETARFYFKYLTEDKWTNNRMLDGQHSKQPLKYSGDAESDIQSVGDLARQALKELEDVT